MNIYALSSSLALFANLSIGLFVFLSNKKQIINRITGLFFIAISLWIVGCLMESTVQTKAEAIFWDKVLYTGLILLPALGMHLTNKIIGAKKKWSFVASYCISFIFLCINLSNLRHYFISDVVKKYIFRYIAVPNIGWFLFVIFLSLNSIYWIVITFIGFRKAKGNRRNQLKYPCIAFIIGSFTCIIYLLLVVNVATPPLDNLTGIIFAGMIAYAVVRHRLLDIKVVFTRGTILLIVYAFIVGVPLVFAGMARPWLLQYLHARWHYPPLALYTVLALLAPYIYLQLQTKAEQKMILRQVRLHQSLKAASKTTIEVQSVDKLSRIIPRYLLRLYGRLNNKIMHITLFLQDKKKQKYILQSSVGEQKVPGDTIITTDNYLVKWFTKIRDKLIESGSLKAKDVEVLVYDDIDYWLNNSNILHVPFKGLDNILKELKKIMESLKASVILPSVYQKELLGFLILGEKTPEPYSVSDIDTFSILANDSAMSFKAAQLFEDLKLAQARLIQSEKLNLLGQLASSMAHEINNPLAIISGNVQLLLMDEDQKKKKDILKKINDQTERGYTIIRRLLNFSRLPKEDIKDINVNDLVDDTLELVNHKILHGNIQLERNYSPVDIIAGNPTQLQEVILNLFVNAIQAMLQGGRLKIFTKQVGDTVQIEIGDTGKGISEEDVKNIFDPFYTKGKENGTGLGLFVATQIMSLHDGKISVRSKVGQGTTFILEFHAKESE